MKTSLNKIMVAALLLLISLVALTPKLTLADQQSSQAGIVVINVSGNAEAINNGLSGSVILNLVGAGSKDANQDLQISNVTGTLSIGSKNLTVSDGHGSTNAHGDIAIFANTSLVGSMLFLHGTVQGNTVTFISPESRLSLISLLSLTGSINVNGVTEATSVSQNTTENTTSSLNSTASVLALNVNSSTLLGNVTAQNTTTVIVPQTSNSSTSLGEVTGVSTAVTNTTSMSISNSTVSEVVAATTSNATAAETANQTTTATVNSALPPQTTTVTVTQFNNQTIIETHTVANTTITQPNTTTTTSNSTSTTYTP